jgi:hypothetical protein
MDETLTSPMNPPAEKEVPRTFPAHWIVTVIALVGTVAVQFHWGAALGGVADWRPYSIAALLAATAWLVATAWLHWRLADWQPAELSGRFRRLLPLAFSDAIVAAFAGLLLWQGHASRVYHAGLWLVPPTLFVVSGTSLAILIAAAVSAGRELQHTEPAAGSSPTPSDRWRTAIVLALLISLGLLGRQPLPQRRAARPPAAPAPADVRR